MPDGAEPAQPGATGRAAAGGDRRPWARRPQGAGGVTRLPEATAVVLEDYAGLTWADLAADRGERIDTAMREFLQHRA